MTEQTLEKKSEIKGMKTETTQNKTDLRDLSDGPVLRLCASTLEGTGCLVGK